MRSHKRNVNRRSQYHPAFCSATELEFRKCGKLFTFEREFLLNTMPNRIDLLIVRKKTEAVVDNEIGAIFENYNIFEYKSPDDRLGKSAFYITNAYANLLVGYNRGPLCLNEITVTFIRYGKPKKLFDFLCENGFTIDEHCDGVYHVRKPGEMNRQIIVIRELSEKHRWLKALKCELSLEEASALLSETAEMSEEDFVRAISVLDLSDSFTRRVEKEEVNMGILMDRYNEYQRKMRKIEKQLKRKEEQLQSKDEQLQSKDEQLQSKEEQLQSKDEQLQSKDEQLQSQEEQLKASRKENESLRRKLAALQKLIDKPAIL